MQLIYGFLLGAAIGALAWRAGSLSASGALGATLTGGLVFGLGGFPWAVLLLAFFVSSSALSRILGARKSILNEKFSKGARRDWGQVLANGGLGAVLVVIFELSGNPTWAWVAFAGCMGAVTADTWATEIGVLGRAAPRLITSGQVVERGTSGAISRTGNLALLGGAGMIGLTASLFPFPGSFPGVLLAATLGGVSGALFDSFLGASIQAIYTCPTCKKETERHPLHSCGSETVHLRGWRWMNNDWVNFACSVVGAGVAAGVWLVFFQ
jgi:uncharacterized protein (TIGR00297 family)